MEKNPFSEISKLVGLTIELGLTHVRPNRQIIVCLEVQTDTICLAHGSQSF